MTSLFLFLTIISFLFCLGVFILCFNIAFRSPNIETDNEKVLNAALRFKLFSWPSKIHEIKNARCELREYWAIGLKIISLFFPKKYRSKEIINVSLSLVSHFVSTVLIYYILNNYFGEIPALFCLAVYAFSFWPYQISIYYGHIIYSQMWFLISISCLVIAFSSNTFPMMVFSFIGGITSVICFASSSSSRKYPPMIYIIYLMIFFSYFNLAFTKTSILLIIIFLISLFLIFIFKEKIATIFSHYLYSEKNDLEYIKAKRLKISNSLPKIVLFLAITLCPLIFISDFDLMYSFIPFILGLILFIFITLLPNVKKNLDRYLHYLNIGYWGSHFLAYDDTKKIFGIILPRDFRGEGVKWIPKYFSIINPICFFITIVSIIYLLIENNFSFYSKISLIFLGLLPTILSEITKSIQVGKSYFPSFIGMIIINCLSLFIFLDNNPAHETVIKYSLLIVSVIILLHSLYIFFSDLYPSRMYIKILHDWLQKNKVKKFSSYKNNYNNTFINLLNYTYPNEFEINYVEKIEDSKDNIFIIPPTSSKSLLMECDAYAIKNGDFRSDATMLKLFDNKKIEKIAKLRLKTFATSNIFCHESEVTSYRKLGLKQITDYDKWLGHGWVLELDKI